MASILTRTNWTSHWLQSRIGEGEALLEELPVDSGWAPIVSGRLVELRNWLRQIETHAAAA
jgi:hypothetical protein